jgi:hypothetical protein
MLATELEIERVIGGALLTSFLMAPEAGRAMDGGRRHR